MTPLDSARQRLVYALDYPDLAAARAGAGRVAGHVGVLKIGLELFVREGPAAIALGEALGCDVFLDLKLHDIPATVERAVRSAVTHGVRYLTVHAAGGRKMLEAAVQASAGTPLSLLAVTVLTSLDGADLASVGVPDAPAEQALRLARLARAAGIPGLVCSAAEVGVLRRELGPDAILVTPGIRPTGPGADDQKRIATPAIAIRDGASLLVVGRPIRDAADPAEAARSIVAEIAGAANGAR
jgi:orotidine-5'-phosphate decarboxylase